MRTSEIMKKLKMNVRNQCQRIGYQISLERIGLTWLFIMGAFLAVHGQVKPKLGISDKTIVEKSVALESGNPKSINLSESVSATKEFATLQQGDYSLVKLKLAGNTTESNYYVKKVGTKLILNGDIVVHDFSVTSTKSYTRDDDTHTFGKDDLYRWPGGNVPVTLDNSVFESDYYLKIRAALNFFNFNTGIVFKERTGEEDYIYIKCIDDDGSGRAGSSPVGRQRNGSNILELIKGKFTEATVIHELMHALGVWHEQSRLDRDNFVEIRFDNVKDDSKFNFQTEGNSTARSAYDYCSIMHYSAMAFAKDNTKPTIACKSNGSIVPCPPCMGAQSLTQQDINGLDEFYRGIGISRFPCQVPFVSSKVPIAGCIGIEDIQIRNKWDFYKDALGDCISNVIGMGIFNATYVQFQNGEIYHSAHGTAAVYGDIFQYYASQGKLGKFGIPLSDEQEIRDIDKGIASWNRAGYTRVSKFEKGMILWGPNKASTFYTIDAFAAGPHPMTKETVTETVKHQRVSNGTKTKAEIRIYKREPK